MPAPASLAFSSRSCTALIAPSPALLEETGASLGQVRFELFSRFVDGFAAVAAALIGFGALMAGGFSRLGFWKEIVLAVVLMALVQSLSNAVAGSAMRDASLAWLGMLPLALAVGAAMALIGWSTRKRRVRT